MTSEQRQKLKDYAAQKDRRPEPVFAGRRDLFKVVEENVHMVSTDGKSTGSTVCITGPAGVGKSAFAAELKRQCDCLEFGGGKVHCAVVAPNEAFSQKTVLEAFENAAAGFDGGGKAGKETTGVGLNLGPVGFSKNWRQKGPPEVHTSFPTRLFRESAAELISNGHVFLLLVDEAQRTAPSPGSGSNALLANLHDGVSVPVVPVLLGQPDTQEKLKETISASRYSYGNEPFMVGLSKEDEREYVEKMFNWLGAEGTVREKSELYGWIAKQCEGWPHHLANCMKVLAEEMLEADSPSLSLLNGAFVEKSLRKRRMDYYASREASQPALAKCKKAAVAILNNALEKPIQGVSLFAEAEVALDKESPRKAHLAEELAEALKMSGMLARRRGEDHNVEWFCPIPSMTAYMEKGHFKSASVFPDRIARQPPSAA